MREGLLYLFIVFLLTYLGCMYLPRKRWFVPLSYITKSHQKPRWVSIHPNGSKFSVNAYLK